MTDSTVKLILTVWYPTFTLVQAARDDQENANATLSKQIKEIQLEVAARVTGMQDDIRSLRTANRKLSKQQSSASLLSLMPPPAMRASREALGGSAQGRSSQKVVEGPSADSPPGNTQALQVCTQYTCYTLSIAILK